MSTSHLPPHPAACNGQSHSDWRRRRRWPVVGRRIVGTRRGASCGPGRFLAAVALLFGMLFLGMPVLGMPVASEVATSRGAGQNGGPFFALEDGAADGGTATRGELEGAVSDQPVAAVAVPKFERDVQPILTAHGCNAGGCHGKSRGQNGFALSLLGFDDDFDYQAIVQESRGRRVFPADPAFSLLLLKGAGVVPHGGGIRLPVESSAYDTVLRWITAGMPRSEAEDPRFVRLEMRPPPRSLQPEETMALAVWAHFSDGSVEEVTGTTFFQSSEPAVVAVDARGQIRAGVLPGDATIMARYRGQIATWNSGIPGPALIPADRYRQLPTQNFIDRLVWEKLQQLNVWPSEVIDDATFQRRAALDVIGRLPTAEEARQFLQDSRPDKREWWIDQLLTRQEYADFWANKWADLLRPNPYRVGIKATQSLDGWLRDVFRENRPYDVWVRQLLTAQGSTWHNGAVTVFRDRRSPDEVATLVSQLFLGVRLECAKCHQHPFEVYGQGDFYSLAAYFARVGYKGTGLSPPISGGEEMVLVRDSGSVAHPVTGAILEPRPLWPLGLAADAEAQPVGVRDPVSGLAVFADDPRAALVDWMTDPRNGGFAEAAANRIWGELFGVGIVDPVDDIRATNPPSNPELLRALGAEFRRLNFDQRALLKTILMSSVYQLSSLPHPTNVNDHRNFSRHYRRLSRAEVIADALADVTGVPDHWPGLPPGARAMQLWTYRSESDLLDVFGRPDPNQDPPCERLPEATMTQALHLMNTPALQAKLTSDAGAPARWAKREWPNDQLLDEIYLTVLTRFPTAEERAAVLPVLDVPPESRRSILERLLWALLNSPEFIYEN